MVQSFKILINQTSHISLRIDHPVGHSPAVKFMRFCPSWVYWEMGAEGKIHCYLIGIFFHSKVRLPKWNLNMLKCRNEIDSRLSMFASQLIGIVQLVPKIWPVATANLYSEISTFYKSWLHQVFLCWLKEVP